MRADPQNNPLPPRMHWKHGAYWRVHRNRWTRLGDTYATSLEAWARHEGHEVEAATVAEAVAAFLDERGGELAEKTLAGYRSSAKRVIAVFGRCALRGGVTRPDVREYLRRRTAGVSANRDAAFLSSVFSYAIERGWCDVNPAKGVRRRKERARTRTASDDDLLRLLQYAPPVWKSAILIGVLTGMREGELRALRRDQCTAAGIELDRPKTGARSLVEWTPELWNAVAWAVHGAAASETVLSARSGSRLSLSGWQSAWRRLREKAGLPDLQFRDLRRTAASTAGDLAHASALLGHGSTTITKRVYRVRDKVKPVR